MRASGGGGTQHHSFAFSLRTSKGVMHAFGMDPSTVQLLTASVGVAGTLAASVLAQTLSRRGDRERRKAEDQSRWLSERLKVTTQLVAAAQSLERDLGSACAFLDRDEREERIPGYTTVFALPDEGLVGIIDGETRELLTDALYSAFKSFDELEQLAAELSIIGGAGRSGDSESAARCIPLLNVFH